MPNVWALPVPSCSGSAATVFGLHGLPRSWQPQVALPPGQERRQRRGVDLHIWDLPAHHIEQAGGLSVTNPVRTVADVCRLLPRDYAVSLVDAALNLGVLRLADVPAILDLMARRRSCVVGRTHLGLAREGAQSPGETRVRLILGDAGLPPGQPPEPILRFQAF